MIGVDPTELTEQDISMHTILLRGINQNIPLAVVQKKLEEMIKKEYGNVVISVHVMGDYMKMLNYLKRLDKM